MRIGNFLVMIALAALPGAGSAQKAAPADREKDHAALRALLVKGAEALNSRNLDGMASSLDANFTIITVDNQKHVGFDAFKKYYLGLFDGPNALLAKLEVRPDADELTRFIDANTGIVYGTSQETYHFRDGDVRTMKTRWSAVTKRERDAWKLVSVHFSASVVDNPLLEAAKSYARKFAAGAAIVGLLVGALLMALLRRRPSS